MTASSLGTHGLRYSLAAGLACAALCTALVQAGQPYGTDDAVLTPAGACQLEVGKRVLRGSRETWLLPACNPTGNLELSLGANHTAPVEGGGAADFVLQAKSLLRKLEPDGYGAGWIANIETHRHPQAGQARVGSLYAAGILSRALFGETIIVHANLGARRLRDQGTTAASWGLQTEFNRSDRLALIVETTDTTRSRRGYQAGVWFALVPERIEFDVSVGGEARDFRGTRYWAVGLRMFTAPFFK